MIRTRHPPCLLTGPEQRREGREAPGAVDRLIAVSDADAQSLQTVGLLDERGADVRQQLITHVVSIEEAPDFVRHLIADQPETLQIVFKGVD